MSRSLPSPMGRSGARIDFTKSLVGPPGEPGPPGPPGAPGSGAAAMVAPGNLPAAYTLNLPSTNVVLIGTLTTATTITVTGLAQGSHFWLLVTQDATGGHTLSLSDGTNTLVLTINLAAGADTVVNCWSPNGTDIVVAGG